MPSTQPEFALNLTPHKIVRRAGIFAAASALLTAACGPALSGAAEALGGLNKVAEAGRVAAAPRNVSDFREVSVRGTGRLVISQSGAESLRIEADENVLPHIIAEVHGGRLLLGPRDGVQLPPTTQIRYVLTVKQLRAVETSGAATVDATDVHVPEMRLGISGTGNARFSGQVERQEVRISGAGSYDGSALESRDARVTTSGLAQVTVNATESLTAIISGAGRVEYIGNPAVIQTVSGAGIVRRR